MPSTKYYLGIGINYRGTRNELRGCINDVLNVEKFFKTKFPTLRATLITDDTVQKPTRDIILAALADVLSKCVAGDTVILHYSGHGTHTIDLNNDERDKRDECIVPLDLKLITDDELYALIVRHLPKDVFLLCLFDSCFSGTVLDLSYTYVASTTPIQVNHNGLQPRGRVVMLSGCRDDQTSADAFLNNSFSGAMTWAFLNAYDRSSHWVHLVANMRLLLRNRYTQVPLLSYSNGINIRSPMLKK